MEGSEVQAQYCLHFLILWERREKGSHASHFGHNVLSLVHFGGNKVRSSSYVMSCVCTNFGLCALLWKMLLQEIYMTSMVVIDEDKLDAIWGFCDKNPKYWDK